MGSSDPSQIPKGASQQDPGQLTPRFKLVFLTLVVFTLLALALHVLLAVFGGDTDQIKTAADTCSTTYKMGFGAIVALMSQRHI